MYLKKKSLFSEQLAMFRYHFFSFPIMIPIPGLWVFFKQLCILLTLYGCDMIAVTVVWPDSG